jgi:hypothetical protein
MSMQEPVKYSARAIDSQIHAIRSAPGEARRAAVTLKSTLQKDDGKSPSNPTQWVTFGPPKPVSINIAAMAT